jgi:hypothetical protein
MARRNRLLLLLGYVAAVAWITYELQRPVSIPPEQEVASDAIPLPRLAPSRSTLGAIDDYVALVERPPFSRSRSEAVTPTVTEPVEATEPDPANFKVTTSRLSAILLNDNEITAVVENGDGTSTRLRKGARFEGWQVNDIRADRIILGLGEQRRELLVHRFDTPPPPVRRTAQPRDAGPDDEPMRPRRSRRDDD